MRVTPAANSDRPEFGITVIEDSDAVSLDFDLDRIAAFRASFGDGAFVEAATRYVEKRAEALFANGELWLWKVVVRAHVTAPEPCGKAGKGEVSA